MGIPLKAVWMRWWAMPAFGLSVLSLGFAGAFPPPQFGSSGQGKPVIRIEDFQKSNVIGKLGVPLGQVVVIEGNALDDGPAYKGRNGTMSLKISRVEQRPLETPAVFLDEQIFNDNGRVHLSEGRYRLAVYESGSFEGLPRGDDYRLPRQGKGFCFQSSLHIVHNFAEKTAPRQK